MGLTSKRLAALATEDKAKRVSCRQLRDCSQSEVYEITLLTASYATANLHQSWLK